MQDVGCHTVAFSGKLQTLVAKRAAAAGQLNHWDGDPHFNVIVASNHQKYGAVILGVWRNG